MVASIWAQAAMPVASETSTILCEKKMDFVNIAQFSREIDIFSYIQ